MNEAETRAELIDPKLKACGWGVVGAKQCEAQILCYDFGPGTEAQLLKRIKDSKEKSEQEWRQIYFEKRATYEKPTLKETIDKIIEV